MRTVFTHDMVAHVWAQQTQSEGRSSGNRMFFEDDTIYSYGRHFPIARFETNAQGQKCIFFTTQSYSVSTAKHIGHVRNAIRNLPYPVFYVERPEYHSDHQIVHTRSILKDEIEALVKIKPRATRKLFDKWATIRSLVEEANKIIDFFGLPEEKLEVPTDLSEVKARVEAKEAAEAEVYRQMEERRKAKQAADMEEAQPKLEEWKRGDLHLLPLIVREIDCCLRISGDVIQTSWGASFPVDHAKRAFLAVRHCKENGKTWEPNGHSIHLGHFIINSIDAEGNVKAGCHFVKWPEIERVARELGIYS